MPPITDSKCFGKTAQSAVAIGIEAVGAPATVHLYPEAGTGESVGEISQFEFFFYRNGNVSDNSTVIRATAANGSITPLLARISDPLGIGNFSLHCRVVTSPSSRTFAVTFPSTGGNPAVPNNEWLHCVIRFNDTTKIITAYLGKIGRDHLGNPTTAAAFPSGYKQVSISAMPTDTGFLGFALPVTGVFGAADLQYGEINGGSALSIPGFSELRVYSFPEPTDAQIDANRDAFIAYSAGGPAPLDVLEHCWRLNEASATPGDYFDAGRKSGTFTAVQGSENFDSHPFADLTIAAPVFTSSSPSFSVPQVSASLELAVFTGSSPSFPAPQVSTSLELAVFTSSSPSFPDPMSAVGFVAPAFTNTGASFLVPQVSASLELVVFPSSSPSFLDPDVVSGNTLSLAVFTGSSPSFPAPQVSTSLELVVFTGSSPSFPDPMSAVGFVAPAFTNTGASFPAPQVSASLELVVFPSSSPSFLDPDVVSGNTLSLAVFTSSSPSFPAPQASTSLELVVFTSSSPSFPDPQVSASLELVVFTNTGASFLDPMSAVGFVAPVFQSSSPSFLDPNIVPGNTLSLAVFTSSSPSFPAPQVSTSLELVVFTSSSLNFPDPMSAVGFVAPTFAATGAVFLAPQVDASLELVVFPSSSPSFSVPQVGASLELVAFTNTGASFADPMSAVGFVAPVFQSSSPSFPDPTVLPGEVTLSPLVFLTSLVAFPDLNIGGELTLSPTVITVGSASFLDPKVDQRSLVPLFTHSSPEFLTPTLHVSITIPVMVLSSPSFPDPEMVRGNTASPPVFTTSSSGFVAPSIAAEVASSVFTLSSMSFADPLIDQSIEIPPFVLGSLEFPDPVSAPGEVALTPLVFSPGSPSFLAPEMGFDQTIEILVFLSGAASNPLPEVVSELLLSAFTAASPTFLDPAMAPGGTTRNVQAFELSSFGFVTPSTAVSIELAIFQAQSPEFPEPLAAPLIAPDAFLSGSPTFLSPAMETENTQNVEAFAVGGPEFFAPGVQNPENQILSLVTILLGSPSFLDPHIAFDQDLSPLVFQTSVQFPTVIVGEVLGVYEETKKRLRIAGKSRILQVLDKKRTLRIEGEGKIRLITLPEEEPSWQ